MYGKIENQVKLLIVKTDVNQIGHSKHEARLQALAEGAKTSHEIAQKTGIYSKGSLNNNFSTWKNFAKFAKEVGNIKNLEQVGSKTVEKFLREKLDTGTSLKSYENTCTHLRKLASTLNSYAKEHNTGKTYSFEKAIERCKDESKKYLDNKYERDSRAYKDPKGLIQEITKEEYRLHASIQLEGGARIRESGLITKDRLAGIKGDRGVISLKRGDCKGGKERELYISKETYMKIEKYIDKNGELKMDDPRSYRAEMKKAAASANQEYTGSHGLRHNYAQNRMNELQQDGKGYKVACQIVSREMGHERPSITEVYLR